MSGLHINVELSQDCVMSPWLFNVYNVYGLCGARGES